MEFLTTITSPNWDERPKEYQSKLKYIILHYTDMDTKDGLDRLCDPLAKVSAHYFIHKNSNIFQLVDPLKRAWHAGKSYWQGDERLNDSSIGIEIDNLGNEEFPEHQMTSCIKLCKYLMERFNIKAENVIGHSDIAPDRKIDPGIYFDWHKLNYHGIGINFNPYLESEISFSELSFSEVKDLQLRFRKIGYYIEINGILDKQTSEVIRSFNILFEMLSHL